MRWLSVRCSALKILSRHEAARGGLAFNLTISYILNRTE